jgi:DhnA family fructose-bisphosphate aldolase class Ia
MNAPKAKEILSWYGSDSPGTLTNLARLLNYGKLGGTGRLVILPVDEGFDNYPARSFAIRPPGCDPRGGFGSIIGRNSFQLKRPEALQFLGNIISIYAR